MEPPPYYEAVNQQFSTGVPRHTDVTRRFHRCAAGMSRKIKRKEAKSEE
jgi:hypothetical protein